MRTVRAYILVLLLVAMSTAAAFEMPVITGETMPDTQGHHINAHGGAILAHDGTYYWYGEHRGTVDKPGQLGVSCYSSTDLHNWENRGIVLSMTDSVGAPLEKGATIERPKVIYNPRTGKFVMWFHHEMKGRGYGAAFAGVAVADTPTGPFRHVRSSRVNAGRYPQGMTEEQKKVKYDYSKEWWTPEWREEIKEGSFVLRDLYGGQMARDMNLYVDDDGTAYHIFSSEDNLTLQIAELDPTFTHHTGKYIRIAPAGHNEAPAVFKHDGTYWMITSGCTGWAPNEARLMKAPSIMGPWEQLPNPCRGEKSEITFGGQSTSVFVNDGKYTFMADVWNPKNLGDSRHLWLPIQFGKDGVPFIPWPGK